MWLNYLTVAWRHLRRQKGYAVINVAGLAVGIACCLLIALYVRDELRYDRFHDHADRIYRLTAAYTDGNHWAPIGPPVGPAVKAEIPEVEQVARVFPLYRVILQRGDAQFEEPDGLYADSTFFEVFTVPLLRGDPATALNRSGTIVLSQRLARTYFGDDDPMGQMLTIAGRGDVTVTGVMKDPPPQTHLPFEYLVSMQTFYDASDDWLERARTWAGFYTYVLLRTPYQAETVSAKLTTFVSSFFADVFDGPAEDAVHLVLQPVSSIHLHSALEKEYRANSDVTYVYVFSVVAAFILLIACVNFVNLSTARAAGRMREVGVRKALGARRTQLVRQFLGESALLVGLALVLAGGLIVLALPAFNRIAAKTLMLHDLAQPSLLLGLAALALCTGLLSGTYPAIVLSGFRPTRALRGLSRSASGTLLRKGLVVFQFAVSIFLIAGTAVVLHQLTFFRTTDLGFDKERVLNVRLEGDLRPAVRNSLDALKETLMQDPAVRHVSLASEAPGERYSLESLTVDGRQDDQGTMLRIAWGVDHDYLRTLGIPLFDGRDFSREAPADTNAWILNEAAVRRLGLDVPVGRILRWGTYAGPIVGVAEDFHFASLHHSIEPLVIPLRPDAGSRLLVRLQAGHVPDGISAVEDALGRLAPGALVRYTFLADDFDALYRDVDALGVLFRVFAGLAVLIACLGLFGLAAFTAEQRTKEIGVRKVLGASVPGIVLLLSGTFARLVLAAFVLAAPAAYLAMDRWLDAFAYRIDISWRIFLSAGLIALLVALLAVGFQAFRAATVSPVKSLRYE